VSSVADLVSAITEMLEQQPVDKVIERVVMLVCERDNYRLIAHQAIDQLHRAVKERDRLRQQRNRELASRRQSRTRP
jgi:hypothetical protein